MSTLQSEHYDAHHDEFDLKNRMPKDLFAVCIAAKDPNTGRRRKFIRTFLSKPEAKRYHGFVLKNLKEPPENVSLLITNLAWEEIDA